MVVSVINGVANMADASHVAAFKRTEDFQASIALAVTQADREQLVEKFNRENCSYYYRGGAFPTVTGGAAMSVGGAGMVVQRVYYKGADLMVDLRGGSPGGGKMVNYKVAVKPITPGSTAEEAEDRMPFTTDRGKNTVVVVSRGKTFVSSTKGPADIPHAIPPMPILLGTLVDNIDNADTAIKLLVYVVGEHWLPEPVEYVIPVASYMSVVGLGTDIAKPRTTVSQDTFNAASGNLGIAAPTSASDFTSTDLVDFHKETVAPAFVANAGYADVMKSPVLLPYNPRESATAADYETAIAKLAGSVAVGSTLEAVVTALTQVRALFADGDVPDAADVVAAAVAAQQAADASARAVGVTPTLLVQPRTAFAHVVDDVAETANARVGDQQSELIRLRGENAHLRAQLTQTSGGRPHVHPDGPHLHPDGPHAPSFRPEQGGIPSRVHARHAVDPLKAKLRQLMRTGASNAEIDALISEIDRLNKLANA